jgi:hypothetical protein
MNKYFVISNSDGDTHVEQLDKEELIKRLTPEDGMHYWGSGGFLDRPLGMDTSYWGDNILIIKGEIVTPTAVKVIEKVDIA